MRRHLMQNPTRRGDDAITAFFLYAWQAAKKLVGNVLAQLAFAELCARDNQLLFRQQLLFLGVETLQQKGYLGLIMNLAKIVIESLNFQPVAVRCHHPPGQQIIQRRSPKHSLFATGVHRHIAAYARRVSRSRVAGKNQTGIFSHIHDATRHYTGTRMNCCVSLFDTLQAGRVFHTAYFYQLFCINHGGIGGQRHRATVIAGAATARNNG